MPIDAARFQKASQPTHLLELMDRDALEGLLNGFAHKLQAGVALLYSTAKPATEQTIERRDPVRHLEVSHPFCRNYRTPQEQDAKCVEWDRRIALKYYRNEWTEPKLFRCHLHLWDMTYPLRVEGNLLGVLFAGQIVIDGNSVRWPEDLAAIWQDVYLDPEAQLSECQTGDILAALPREASPEHVNSLDEFVRMGEGMKKVGAGTLVRRYRDFQDFGRTLESLLTSIYSHKIEAEGRRLLQDVAKDLVTNTTTRREWWGAVASAVESFREATGTGPIEVYYGDAFEYIQVVDETGFGERQEARRVPVRHCLALARDQIVSLSEDSDTTQLAAHLGLEEGGWLFRFEPAAVDERRSSIIFVFHKPPAPLAEEFCRIVALRAQITDLLFRSVEDRQAFERRVRNITHAAKTPLMVGFSEIRRAMQSLDFESSPDEIRAHIDNAVDAIYDARAEIAQVYSRVPTQRCELDICELLHNLADKLGPLAEAKRCRIVFQPAEEPLRSMLCEAEANVAFRNLLDNAIKYSFSDKEIRIEARVAADGWAEIVFGNYGVGIPDDKRDQILREGGRGEVSDPVKPTVRPGTGLGVPIAMEILHSHGGALDLESRPTHGTKPGTWLHCVTRAIVTLPLLKEKH